MVQVYRWLFRKALRPMLTFRWYRLLDCLKPLRLPWFPVKLHAEHLERRDVPAPLDAWGAVIVAAKGYEFSGDVGVASPGFIHTLTNFSATIQWGDGTVTAGTIDPGTGRISGDHTYQHEGIYAMAIRVVDPYSTDSLGYAGGLAMVMDPWEHTGVEKVDSVTTWGGGLLEVGNTDVYSLATNPSRVGFSYSMSETVAEPDGTRSLSRYGFATFDMTESGTDFDQPDSSIDLTASEADGVGYFQNGSPDLYGETFGGYGKTYTFHETGTGAVYSWDRTETSGTGQTAFLTDTAGSYNKVMSTDSTLTGSGVVDFVSDTFSEVWSGTNTSSYALYGGYGYVGESTYFQTRTAAGSFGGSESGTISTMSFVRNQNESGSFSRDTTRTFTDGSDTGGGSYSYSLAAEGSDLTGSVTFTNTNTESYTGSGTSTRESIESSLTDAYTLIDTITTNGSNASGAYTMVTLHSNTETTTATTTRVSTPTSTDDNTVGTHTLRDGDTRTITEGGTYTRTGNAVTGSYSLHATESSTLKESSASSDAITAAGTLGSTATENWSDNRLSTTTKSDTEDQTGVGLDGNYSLHETWSSSVTGVDTDSESTMGAPGDGKSENDLSSKTDTDAETNSGTLDYDGDYSTGDYSEHQTDTTTSTFTGTGTSSDSTHKADGATAGDSGTDRNTAYQTTTNTSDRYGNFLNGSYSLHETTGVTDAEYDTSGEMSSDAEMTGASEGETASNTWSRSGSSTRTLDELGADNAYGFYTYTATGTSTGTKTVSATATPTDSNPDGSSDGGTHTSRKTVTETVSTSDDGGGARKTGQYSLHEVSSTTLSETARSTDTGSEDGADGSSDDSSSTETDTTSGTQTFTTDATGNEVEGWSYSYSTTTWSGSKVLAATHGATDTNADGSDDGDTGSDGGTTYQLSTQTASGYNDILSGSYSHSETFNTSETGTETGSDTGTDDAFDGSIDSSLKHYLRTLNDSTSGGWSESGNRIDGQYTRDETDSSSDTDTEVSTDTDTDDLVGGDEDSQTVTGEDDSSETTGNTTSVSGNRVTGISSRHEVDSYSMSDGGVSTATAEDDLEDGSEDDDRSTSTDSDSGSGGTTIDWVINGVTGDYSRHVVSSSSMTRYGTSTDTGTDDAADGSETDDLATDLSTIYELSYSTLDRTGNESTGSYSEHEVTNGTTTNTGNTTDDGTDHLADTSDEGDVESGYDFSTEVDDATVDRTGNSSTGTYSEHEVHSASISGGGTSTDTGNDDLSDGSENDDTATSFSTFYQLSGSTVDRTGNAAGSYSVHEVNTSSSTEYGSSTDSSTDDLADGAEKDGLEYAYSTVYQSSGSTVDRTGNAAGSYSVHEVDTSSSTEYDDSTGTSTDDLAGGDGEDGTDADLSTVYELSGSTVDSSGDATGSYSQHETGTSTATEYDSPSSTGIDHLADGTRNSSGSNDMSLVRTATHGLTRTGNSATGAYTLSETNTTSSTATEHGTSSEDSTGADASTQDDGDGGTTTTTDSETTSVTETGNSSTGTYTRTNTDDSTHTVVASHTGDQSLTATGGWTDSQASTDLDTVVEIFTSTATRSGNNATGSFTLTEADGSTVTDTDVKTVDGLDSTTTSTDTESSTVTDDGNDATGIYSMSTITSHATSDSSHGTDGRGTYTATSSGTTGSTVTESGNRGLGTRTLTDVETATTTVLTTGSNVSTSYGRSETDTESSTDDYLYDDIVGSSLRTFSRTTGMAATETGLTNAAYSYTITESDSSDYVAATVFAVLSSGAYLLTENDSSSGSLHETGTGPSGGYTMDKSTSGSDFKIKVGNEITSEYTLDDSGSNGSTAQETVGDHGSTNALWSTFTEILSNTSTSHEVGNDRIGDYSRSETGTRSRDFEDHGFSTASLVSSVFAVTEGSSTGYTQAREGNGLTGLYTMSEADDNGYSFTEVINSTTTLSESGDDVATVAEAGDDLTGDYSRSEDGVDLFTLREDGGAVTVTVTGTDGYTGSESGNNRSQSFTRTTTGGGHWDRAGSTLSGTTAYTLSESGDAVAGHFAKTETGTDRYGLVPSFVDASNTSSGADPGNVTYHTHGLPFQDPNYSLLKKPADLSALLPPALKAYFDALWAKKWANRHPNDDIVSLLAEYAWSRYQIEFGKTMGSEKRTPKNSNAGSSKDLNKDEFARLEHSASSKNNFEKFVPNINAQAEYNIWKKKAEVEGSQFKVRAFRKKAGVGEIFNEKSIKDINQDMMLGEKKDVPSSTLTIELKDKNKTKIVIYRVKDETRPQDGQFVCHSYSLGAGGPGKELKSNFVVLSGSIQKVLLNKELFDEIKPSEIKKGDIVVFEQTLQGKGLPVGNWIHSFRIIGGTVKPPPPPGVQASTSKEGP